MVVVFAAVAFVAAAPPEDPDPEDEDDDDAPASATGRSDRPDTPRARRRERLHLPALLPGAFLFAVSASTYVGARTYPSFAMFSNLRVEGGSSNHWVVRAPGFFPGSRVDVPPEEYYGAHVGIEIGETDLASLRDMQVNLAPLFPSRVEGALRETGATAEFSHLAAVVGYPPTEETSGKAKRKGTTPRRFSVPSSWKCGDESRRRCARGKTSRLRYRWVRGERRRRRRESVRGARGRVSSRGATRRSPRTCRRGAPYCIGSEPFTRANCRVGTGREEGRGGGGGARDAGDAARTSSGLPQAERSTFESTRQSGRARVQINHMGVRLRRARVFGNFGAAAARTRASSAAGASLPRLISARGRVRRKRGVEVTRGDRHGLRRAREGRRACASSWNAWPSSRIEATRVVLPFGAVCTR